MTLAGGCGCRSGARQDGAFSPGHSGEPMSRIGWHDLRREPFRLLFPLGLVFGCLGVSHWLWYALGWAASSRFYHASIQIGAYMVCFIAGFLWTAMPRMTATRPATSFEMVALLALLAAQTLFLAVNYTVAAQVCFAALLILLASFAIRRRGQRSPSGVGSPVEFMWVPVGVLFGVVGSGLAASGQAGLIPSWWIAVGRPMAQQGFVLAVVLGVGGFMGPRLLGRGFEWAATAIDPARARHIRRGRIRAHAVAAALIAASFFIEGAGYIAPAYLLRAVVVSTELWWSAQLHRPPAIQDAYVRLLWVSLWMVAIGFWAAGCWPRYRIAMLHFVFIGGFSLMTFAVGTMVVMSHSGQAQALRRPLWVLNVVAVGIAGATAMRVLADLWPMVYFPSLGMAASLWLIAAVSWLIFISPRILRKVPEGTFERLHEQAKHQVLRPEPGNPPSSTC